jgi:broad specificity phosphatase PhoE
MNLPQTLWLARHGESIANIARHKAEAEGRPEIDFPMREPDVPLSDVGVKQSMALGETFAALAAETKPTRVYTSPFLRTIDSARILAETAGIDPAAVRSDERLREREMGIFDRLTMIGARQKYPEECVRREHLGKYYYRAPGGENWCDVILRVRSFWEELLEKEQAANILIVTHEVVIRSFSCVIESLGEPEIMEKDRASDFANGAITEYKLDRLSGTLQVSRENYLPGL